MDLTKQLENLHIFLSERSAFCIVYKVTRSPDNKPELIMLCGTSAFDEDVVELAEHYKGVCLERYNLAKNGIMPFDTSRIPRNGRRWRGMVISSGATLDADCVIVTMVLAKDNVETFAYMEGIQRIMLGEELLTIYRPGGW